ncbi:DUF6049 family protein [Streptomyces sp. B1866]|uniref:DUF6049 family protein n=1 Tax=Streptomyces sp. B1866 TaxID=3075431 RepID=UPI0028906FA1|nr:DUF6049 family protein [Streptomyces sp. B1866]MDT3395273.1 DUF6049 family protein [Streptomyces sp. B1866]
MAEAAGLQGTNRARAGRWLRRAAALLAGVTLLTGTGQIPAVSPAHAASKASGSRSVNISVDSLTPSAPTREGTLTVRGTAVNESAATVSGAAVTLLVGPRMNGRSEMDAVSERTGYVPGVDGVELPVRYAKKIGTLRPGARRSFSLAVPVSALGLGQSGVYQLSVAVAGQTAAQPLRHVTGVQRTFLPWQPGRTPKQTQLTFLWPLISRPHVTARTTSDGQRAPVFSDDVLAREMGQGGRLQQLVALGKDLPVTWVLDPDLLATADAMTRPYQVVEDGGAGDEPRVADGTGQAVAKQWLADLEKALRGHQVVVLPFADPDLAAIAHRGRGVPGTLGRLRSATALAVSTVETVFSHRVTPRTDIAWPVDGAIDQSIVDVAASAGARTVIARSDSLRETGNLLYTPTAARPIGRGRTAVVADARLSTVFTGDLGRAENATLAVQEFLAQTQMITLQAPERKRSIVVAPQRTPTTEQVQAMATALRDLAPGRWTQPLDLGQAAKAKTDPNATRRVPSGKAYRASLRRQELSVDGFRAIRSTQDELDVFGTILTVRDPVVIPFTNAILRELSTSWRGTGGRATAARTSVKAYLDGLVDKVQLVRKSDITLSGRSATIPVTVQNNLVQDVKGLRLVLSSSQRNRLAVTEPQPISVEGGHSQSVKFGTTANANGRAEITAQLVTEDGRPYGQAVTFQVNVTEITSTVILVIAGGVLLLVLAGVRIYLKRKRNAARRTAAADPAQAAPAAVGGGGASAVPAQQPGDVEPDTGSQSADTSGPGEKVDH